MDKTVKITRFQHDKKVTRVKNDIIFIFSTNFLSFRSYSYEY